MKTEKNMCNRKFLHSGNYRYKINYLYNFLFKELETQYRDVNTLPLTVNTSLSNKGSVQSWL